MSTQPLAAGMSGAELRRARELAGLSVGQAIRLLGLHNRSTLEDVEAGTRQPDSDLCRRMDEVYHVAGTQAIDDILEEHGHAPLSSGQIRDLGRAFSDEPGDRDEDEDGFPQMCEDLQDEDLLREELTAWESHFVRDMARRFERGSFEPSPAQAQTLKQIHARKVMGRLR